MTSRRAKTQGCCVCVRDSRACWTACTCRPRASSRRFSPQKTRKGPTRSGGTVVGVDCGLARPRLPVQLNPSLDGLDDGHRPWIDLATGRTAPSMVRRRQLCVVHRQLHHAALVSVGDVLAAFCVPGPRHLSRWSLGFLPETVGIMRSCIVLVRQW